MTALPGFLRASPIMAMQRRRIALPTCPDHPFFNGERHQRQFDCAQEDEN